MSGQPNRKATSARTSRKNYGLNHHNLNNQFTHCQQGNESLLEHYQEREQLLPTSIAWERLFLLQLIGQSSLNIFQKEKLLKIKKSRETKQIKCCNYMKTATWPSSKKYFCSECGNWIGFTFAQRIFGGEADA